MIAPVRQLVSIAIAASALLCGSVAGSQGGALREHGALAELRESLRAALEPTERTALDAVDASGTSGAAGAVVSFLASDRAVRVFVPLALDALGRQADATRLRRMAPLVNRATARAAHSVLEHMPEQPMRTLDPMYSGPVDLCFFPVTAARMAAQSATYGFRPGFAPATSGPTVGRAACAAMRAGASRATVITAVIALFTDAVAAVRAGRGHPRTR
ncbi:MAG: hypothetical protein WCJ30_00455 [Deltaproteobacteria bacterium]